LLSDIVAGRVRRGVAVQQSMMERLAVGVLTRLLLLAVPRRMSRAETRVAQLVSEAEGHSILDGQLLELAAVLEPMVSFTLEAERVG
jgi:hypothetical protein